MVLNLEGLQPRRSPFWKVPTLESPQLGRPSLGKRPNLEGLRLEGLQSRSSLAWKAYGLEGSQPESSSLWKVFSLEVSSTWKFFSLERPNSGGYPSRNRVKSHIPQVIIWSLSKISRGPEVRRSSRDGYPRYWIIWWFYLGWRLHLFLLPAGCGGLSPVGQPVG